MVSTDIQARDANSGAWGPATRFRLARLALIYSSLYLSGLLLIHSATTPGWRAFGLGLMLPGGGFLAYTTGDPLQIAIHVALTLCGLLAFGLGLVVWFATGNVLVPPLVWLLAAVAALAMNHPPGHGQSGEAAAFVLLPLGLAGLIAGSGLWTLAARHLEKRAGQRNDLYVMEHRQAQIERLRRRPAAAEQAELSESDIARLRFLLDRALQPLEDFEGFQWIDQFQSAAVRYQLSCAGYALSFAQTKYLPAFRGYYAQAQRNLIEKQKDHRVWRYWRRENIWGNLRSGADPIPRDNIMYTGFVAAQIACYQAATGDLRFSEPGAFTLSHPDGSLFAHDFHTMVAAIKDGWSAAPYTLMACEPNWVYPLCNGIGATAVIAHDHQFGRQAWREIEPHFQGALQRELTTPAGRLVTFRSTYTGIASPQFGGAVAEAFPCVFYNTVLPDLALRHWLLARRDMLKADGALETRRFWPIDTGDYRFSRASSYAGVAAASAQMGDHEVTELVLAALEEDCPSRRDGGVIHRANASVWAHTGELMARFGAANGLTSLISAPSASPQGPVIDTDAYPQCLVAKAQWQDNSLRAVLYPGRADGPFTLTVAGFSPGATYRCEGCSESAGAADPNGRAEIEIVLSGRSELTVWY